ncbi:hypothetical protein [Gordonia sp. NB41Y]|uniref:hypothetical protein n=1 Tax=Gordonia sp. NB41Y TaxID=875808 RepID=UPI0006B1DE51|nr:hypothetical protein [Gordonia sp. NB41Y]WLP89151.1 hypothetical protein Q9K23_16275 [Gordonia sp. NB41Y]
MTYSESSERLESELTSPLTVATFRRAVDMLATQAATCPVQDLGGVIRRGLDTPAISAVLDHHLGDADGREQFTADLIHSAMTFRPNGLSSARDVPALLKVRLLSTLDAVWWAGTRPFRTDIEVTTDAGLIDLRQARSRGELRFDFRTQVFDLPRRGVRALDRRLRPRHSPRTIGMRLPYGRPEVIAVLNAIADDLAHRAPNAPRPWVNSLVRSVAYQDEMRGSGYTAASGSAHCLGWAADIEMDWMTRLGFGDALAAVLLDRADAAEINVIDEGQAWHICLNPRMRRTVKGEPCAE